MAAAPMRALEATLDVAVQFEIDFLITLMPVVIGSQSWLPGWLLDPLSWSNQAIVAGHSESRRAAIDLFQSEVARNVATRMVREAITAFDEHPAVSGWVLGDRLSEVSRPRSLSNFEHWLGIMADEARAARPSKPLYHGVSARDIVESDVVDITVMAQFGLTPAVALRWRPDWARAGDRAWTTFVVAYCNSQCEAYAGVRGGLIVTDVGGCPLLPAALEECVGGADEGGARRVGVSNLFDYSPELRRSPPFARWPAMQECGLLDRRGVLTAAGRTFIDLQDSLGERAGDHRPFPAPDPDARRRSPAAVARECYEEMLR